MTVDADPKPDPAEPRGSQSARHHLASPPAVGLLLAAVLMFMAPLIPEA